MESICENVYRSMLFDQAFLMYYMNKLLDKQKAQIEKNKKKGIHYKKTNHN